MTHQSDRSDPDIWTFEIGDKKVNRLGFGAMRLPDDRERAGEILRLAIDLGVNFIDTADAYGASENFVRHALHPYPEDVFIATKGGLVFPENGSWHADGRPEHLKAACDASLKRLGVEEIALYHLHLPDPEVPFEESVGALAELREEGKIRHVGLSNVSVSQLEAAMEIVAVASVQNRYSIADRGDETLVDFCERNGIAYLPYRPLDTGDPTKPGGPLDEIAESHGATPGQIALAWLLHRSPVIVPIPGTSSPDHLEQNVAAAGISLSEKEMSALDTL